MVVISANYLLGNNFFSISTHHSNSELYIWQSFKLKNQLHTHLKLDYETNRLLCKTDNSNDNYILSVSEMGGNLTNLFKKGMLTTPRVIQICSFEAVRQLHPRKTEEDEKSYVARILEAHRKYLLAISDDDDLKQAEERLSRLTLLFIPFSLHNHHMTLLLKKKGSSSIGYPNFEIEFDSAVYIWRRGFSTQANPILMKKDVYDNNDNFVVNDLKTLYNIFIKYFGRGIKFLYRNGISVKTANMRSNLNIPRNYKLARLDTYDEEKLNTLIEDFWKFLPQEVIKVSGNS